MSGYALLAKFQADLPEGWRFTGVFRRVKRGDFYFRPSTPTECLPVVIGPIKKDDGSECDRRWIVERVKGKSTMQCEDLRDRFAMAALTGMLAARWNKMLGRRHNDQEDNVEQNEALAADAFDVADACMRERMEE